MLVMLAVPMKATTNSCAAEVMAEALPVAAVVLPTASRISVRALPLKQVARLGNAWRCRVRAEHRWPLHGGGGHHTGCGTGPRRKGRQPAAEDDARRQHQNGSTVLSIPTDSPQPWCGSLSCARC
jgi:hypothetical protein